MRTVSFSDPNVRELLNSRFVNVFTDTTGDPTAGGSTRHAPHEPAGFCIRGNGQQNVQTLFMTPSGEIFHVATGFLSPQDLYDEASFALQLFERMSSAGLDRREMVVAAHRKRLADAGFSEAQVNARHPMQAMMSGMAGMGMPGMRQIQSGGTGQVPVTGQLPDMNDVFSGMIRQQMLSDNRFSMDYPLLSWKSLQDDPARLVGNGTSFFTSSSSGMPMDGR